MYDSLDFLGDIQRLASKRNRHSYYLAQTDQQINDCFEMFKASNKLGNCVTDSALEMAKEMTK